MKTIDPWEVGLAVAEGLAAWGYGDVLEVSVSGERPPIVVTLTPKRRADEARGKP